MHSFVLSSPCKDTKAARICLISASVLQQADIKYHLQELKTFFLTGKRDAGLNQKKKSLDIIFEKKKKMQLNN